MELPSLKQENKIYYNILIIIWEISVKLYSHKLISPFSSPQQTKSKIIQFLQKDSCYLSSLSYHLIPQQTYHPWLYLQIFFLQFH